MAKSSIQKIKGLLSMLYGINSGGDLTKGSGLPYHCKQLTLNHPIPDKNSMMKKSSLAHGLVVFVCILNCTSTKQHLSNIYE